MKQIFWPQLLVCGMLVWALNSDNSYGYYQLLRIVCCAVFAYLAIHAAAQKQQGLAWVLGVTAFVYNPLWPVHFPREVWSVVNIASIVIALWSIGGLRHHPPADSKVRENRGGTEKTSV